jgi:ribonuclease P protein component
VRILSPPFTTSACCCFWSCFGHHGAEHEAPLSTQQPAPQARPRIPRADGHEGWSPRPEPPPREGPQAPRGLIAVATHRAVPSPASRRFPRASRLTDKPQFDVVHRQGQRHSDALFLVITRPNETGHARLGLAVGVKAAGNAAQRNRLKRLARESFRHRQQELPPVDVVINARPGAARADNTAIRASLAAHWDRIVRRCARS